MISSEIVATRFLACSGGMNANTSREPVIWYRAPCRSTRRADRTSERHRSRHRRQARAGHRDDDKRETKGRRHPPGYIPDALWPAKPRPRTSHPRGFPSCLHPRAHSLSSSSFPFAGTCSTLDPTDVMLFTHSLPAKTDLPSKSEFKWSKLGRFSTSVTFRC